jgi:hypothetical protein
MPGSHAEALYALRQHLRFVRDRLTRAPVACSELELPPTDTSAEDSTEE